MKSRQAKFNKPTVAILLPPTPPPRLRHAFVDASTLLAAPRASLVDIVTRRVRSAPPGLADTRDGQASMTDRAKAGAGVEDSARSMRSVMALDSWTLDHGPSWENHFGTQ